MRVVEGSLIDIIKDVGGCMDIPTPLLQLHVLRCKLNPIPLQTNDNLVS